MLASPRGLVMEDDPWLREMLREALEGEGYQVLMSDHPVAPLDVQQLRPALAVLDLMLAGEPKGYALDEFLAAVAGCLTLPSAPDDAGDDLGSSGTPAGWLAVS